MTFRTYSGSRMETGDYQKLHWLNLCVRFRGAAKRALEEKLFTKACGGLQNCERSLNEIQERNGVVPRPSC